MGGFMPTPAAPAQPPQVKLDTTAISRGNFNTFLKNMNGATSLNPPSMAPMVGANSPLVAPTMSDIDIFNPPVQNFFFGGSAMSGGAFSDADIGSQIDSFDSGSDNDSGDDNQQSFVDDDPVAGFDFTPGPGVGGGSFDVVSTPTVTGDEQQQNIQDAETFVTGLPKINFTNQSIENAFNKLNVPEKLRKELRPDLQDRAKNNDIVGALDAAQKESAEFDKISLNEQLVNNIIQASNVNPVSFSRLAFNQAGTSSDVLGDAEDDLGINLKSALDTDRSPGRMQAVFGPETASMFGGLTPREVMNIANITQPGQTGNIEIIDNAFKNRQIASLVNKTLGRDEFVNPEDRIKSKGVTPDVTNLTDTGLRGSLTPGVSQDVIDTAKNAIRASAGNNLAIDNLVAQFGNLDPTIGQLADRTKRGVGEIGQIRPEDVEDLSGTPTRQGVPVDNVFDIDTTTSEESRVGDDFDIALDMADREKVVFDEDDPDSFEDRYNVRATVPDAAKIFGGKAITNLPTGTTATSTVPEDFEENVGLPFSGKRMTDIERLYNVPEGQKRLGEGDDPTFLQGLGVPGIGTAIGDFIERKTRENMATQVALGRPMGLGETLFGYTAPSMFVDKDGRALVSDAAGKTVPSSTVRPETFKQYTDRLQRNIIGPEGDTTSFSAKTIPESQLIRNNRGRITAITDASGRTTTGYNPDDNIFDSGDDTQLPIIRRPIVPPPEEEKKADKPGQIGNVIIRDPQSPTATVVASPFDPSASQFRPVTFDTGDLNRLIQAITGIPARPIVSAQEGGLIRAVDDFLATGR